MANVAMLVGNGFEDSEFQQPFEALHNDGNEIVILGNEGGTMVNGKKLDTAVTIDSSAADVSPEEFDLLVIPGGHGPDNLRTNKDVVNFVRRFANSGRPVAAVCHGPQLLIEADVVKGRTVTSWPSVKTDLINAGARWVDKEIVEDENLITSRKPADLETFCRTIVARLQA